ncbi:MAG: Fe-S cluster assembly protein SufD [Porphyromonadaceae bacterium]|nr:Fe-S cluster assembly protein SufD [Porphyromonadaceae bacterium]
MGQLESQLTALAPTEGLCPCRQVALQRFARLGVPAYRSEAYQRTDLKAMFEGKWTLTPGRYEGNMDSIAWPEGSYVGSLSGFKGNLPKIASTDTDPIQALIEGLDDHTFLVYVPKGGKVSERFDYSYFLEQQVEGAMYLSRFILVLDDEAELNLIGWERNTSAGRNIDLQSTEIYLGTGAKLSFTSVEDSEPSAQRISTLHLYQEADSQVSLNVISLRAGKTRNNYHCDLSGEGASLTLSGVVIGSDESHVDNFSYISHSVPHCTSNELFKYLLHDRSYGVFTGRILVAEGAQKTLAYQNNRNLLLSSEARMQAKPQLEIYADDVKCSHGMTTGQLSESALFYMRQRGIPMAEAKKLLSVAFAAEVLESIEDEALRERLLELVATRFD